MRTLAPSLHMINIPPLFITSDQKLEVKMTWSEAKENSSMYL